jgi:hypothetical protein
MRTLDLTYLRKWIGGETIDELCERRKRAGEIRRERTLGTLETLLLCLGVALHSESDSLHDIIRRVTTELGIRWTVSVSGFCRSRIRFSPGEFSFRLSQTCR